MEYHQVVWPGWETVRLIGRGGFGAVYEIQRDIFGETEKAALKIISIPQNDGDIEDLYNDGYSNENITNTFKSHLKSIVGEYSLMRKMNGCSNIVSCDDIRYVQHDDGIGWDIFIKMELLTPLVKSLPSVIEDEIAVRVGKDICAALELCKKYDIVHRDIKPQNIFVSDNGDYKLGDFGIAKTVEKTMGGTKIGTYKYMAPEVYHNKPYGSSADIYSLGLVLYWMLNERRMPFMPLPPSSPSALMEEEARNRRLSGEALPEPKNGSAELKRIVLKACAYDVSDRYATAAEMLSDLKKLDAAEAVVAVPAEKISDDFDDATEIAEEEKTISIFHVQENEPQPVAEPKDEDDEPTVGLFEQEDDNKTEILQTVAKPAETDIKKNEKIGDKKKQKKSSKGKIAIIAVALALLAVAIILLLVKCDNKKPSETSSEAEWIIIPDVLGDAQDVAIDKLKEAGVVIDEILLDYSEIAPSGQVILVSIPEGTPVEKGAKITITVSKGPATFAMPDVVGQSRENAEEVLTANGLMVTVSYQKTDAVQEGNVLSQSIAANERVKRGDKVTIVISSGKDVIIVDDVVGMSQSKAKGTLTKKGFFVSVTEEYDAKVPEGNVIMQWPEAGTAQPHGSTIVICISLGKQPVVITFNGNGGKLSEASKIGYVTDLYGSLPIPSRDGYDFLGWYTASVGGNKITQNTVIEKADDHTVYAQWELKPLSDWVLASDVPSGAIIVNQKWTYTKTTYKVSDKSTMTGYTLYDTSSKWGEYGAWTAWSSTAVTASNSRQVETKTVTDKAEYTQYRYWRYRQVDSTKIHWCEKLGKSYHGGEWYKQYTDWSNSAKKVYNYSYGYCDCHGVIVAYGEDGYLYYWQETRTIPAVTHTEYRYRERSLVYTYYFMKQENLESNTEITASSDISNVKQYVQYREK